MDIVHRSTVTDDMIDHLGHMNVRYYGMFAERASKSLLAGAEVVRPDQRLLVREMYTRHHREQMTGARLATRGGFVSIERTSATVYSELFNVDTDVLAATFVRTIEVVGGQFLHTSVSTIDVPPHGQPRSLSLTTDLLADAPSIEELRERGRAMRYPRRVTAEECGPDGSLDTERIQELFWMGEPIDPRPWDMRAWEADRPRVAMAVVESRTVVGRLPREGDEVQSFGAMVAVGDKTTTRQQWVMEVGSGEALVVSMSVGLALDLEARRAVSLPPAMRAEAEASLTHGPGRG